MNILIIENNQEDFENVRTELRKNNIVNSPENIFPLLEDIEFGKDSNHYNDFMYLCGEYTTYVDKNLDEKYHLYNKIYDYYNDTSRGIECYIIDRELVNRYRDQMGLEFVQFLINEKNVSKNNIFITTPAPIESLDVFVDKDHFILKENGFERELIRNILISLKGK